MKKLNVAAVAVTLSLLSWQVHTAKVMIDAADPQNGIYEIYSATFDGPLMPGGDPFFNGTPPPNRAITLVPNPTGVTTGVPGGFAVPPAPGAFLDLTLGAGNTQLTIAGGTIVFADLSVVIEQGTPDETNILVSGGGMVFDPAPVTVPVDGNGVAVVEVDLTPSLAVDFSTLTDVMISCTGPLCPIVSILTLDMIRYRFIVNYDPTFTSFIGVFTGQTANNSMVFATLKSVTPIPADTDDDGINDDQDNCTLVPNGPVIPDAGGNSQLDSDTDGYGNACDADLDNSGVVNFADLAQFRIRFGTNDPDADFNGTGVVNFADLAIFRGAFGQPPGPSGLVVLDESPAGIYIGNFLSTTSGGLSVFGVISENSDVWFRSQPVSFRYAGTVAVDGNALTGTLTEYRGSQGAFYGFDGTSTIELDGTVTEGDGMFGEYTGVNDEGLFFLDYLTLYERSSSLYLLEGVWVFSLASSGGGVYTVALEIDANGQLFGSDTAGCVFSGELSIIDVRYNAYRVAVGVSSCNEVDGDYDGLAFLSDFLGQNNQLDLAMFNARFAFDVRLTKQ